ncbi:SH3 domain-containing protein [Pseudomonas paraveronii]|uniref:SH3 domain-containing protein n=1 Tax=Pseudomonas paraveronii TaxID=3040598 RepID=UPI002AB32643|nr:SH3 domain-containing protein [Pseudomonas sp. V3/K/3/5]
MEKHDSKETESVSSGDLPVEESALIDVAQAARSTREPRWINRLLTQHEDLLGLSAVTKNILQQQKIFETGAIAQTLRQQQNIFGIGAATKAILQQHNALGIGNVAKALLQQHNALGIGDAAKSILQQHNALSIGEAAKAVLQQYNALGISAVTKDIFHRNSILGIGGVAKSILQQQDALGVNLFKDLIEQQKTALGFTSASKFIDSISLQIDSTLKNATLEGLIAELKTRNLTPTPDTTNTQIDQAPELGQIEKSPTPNTDTQSNSAKEKNRLSSISTLTLIILLQIMVFIALRIENWEATRQSIVDINSRLPQTESFSAIRKFIRTELAGKPGDIRLTKGAGVPLRQGPSTKSGTILKLPENSVVVVLEKTDRSWLFVSYEHQGYWIEGYISNKQLISVRK